MAHTNSSAKLAEPYLKRILTCNGSQHGWNAFQELCRLGCDRDQLSWSFLWLYDEPVSVKEPDEGKHDRFEMQVSPLDSAIARGDYSLSELDSIAKLAKDLQEHLRRIRQIPFVRDLIVRRAFPPNDLLYPDSLFLPNQVTPQLNGLISLGDLARKFGSQKRPHYTQRLKDIYHHIHKHTGQWHDRLVANILTDLGSDEAVTEDSLKVWRHRNDCH